MLIGAIVAFDGPDSLACSGPGAARAIRTSILIGRLFVGVSAAIVAAGSIYLSRRSHSSPIGWLLAALALQPGWWMSAAHGDCGYALRFWSFVGTIWIAGAVVLGICWPLSIDAQSKPWRWRTAGALAGGLFGVLVALLILLKDPGGSPSATSVILAGSTLGSMILAGTMVGGGLFHRRSRGGRRFTFSLRTLLLLPFVLTPPIIALFPILPYQYSLSTSRPCSFLVVDIETGQPIPNAIIQIIDPTFAAYDTDNQGERVLTDAAGSAPYALFANDYGREGLLGRIQGITYNPALISVDAAGYRPFLTSLAADPSISRDRLTARPLALPFPPPPSVTIRLSPIKADRDAESKPDSQPPPR